MIAALLLAVELSSPAQAEVVAHVGDAEVTAAELRDYLDDLPEADRAAAGKDPAALQGAVRGYLARRAVLAVALAKRFDQQPSVKARLERVREAVLVERYLQQVCQPPPGYPSDSEAQAAYQAEAARGGWVAPRQYRVAQIFVAAPSDQAASAKAQEKIDALAAKLREPGADFAAVARAETEERGAQERGGEIGWLFEAQMVAGIRPALLDLAPGAVSAPVRMGDGWHLLKLLEVKPERVRPLSEVKEALVARMRAERAQANRQVYLSKLLEEDPPSIDAAALSRALGPSK